MDNVFDTKLGRAFSRFYMTINEGDSISDLVREMTNAPSHELLQWKTRAEEQLKQEQLRKVLLLGVLKLMLSGELYQSLRAYGLIKGEPVKYVEFVDATGTYFTRMVTVFDDLDLIALQNYFLSHEATEETSKFINFLTWARENKYLRMPTEQELARIERENL